MNKLRLESRIYRCFENRAAVMRKYEAKEITEQEMHRQVQKALEPIRVQGSRRYVDMIVARAFMSDKELRIIEKQ